MQVIQKSVVKKITQNKNVNIEDFEWFVDAIKEFTNTYINVVEYRGGCVLLGFRK